MTGEPNGCARVGREWGKSSGQLLPWNLSGLGGARGWKVVHARNKRRNRLIPETSKVALLLVGGIRELLCSVRYCARIQASPHLHCPTGP